MTTFHRPLSVCGLAALTACSMAGTKGSGGGPQPGSPNGPALPDVSTLSVDLSVSQGGLNLDGPLASYPRPAKSSAPPTQAAYLEASDVVLAVSVDLASPLVLPVSVLRSAASVAPHQATDGTWVRSVLMSENGRSWTANVIADDLGSGQSAWSMQVTSPADAYGCCTAFEVATGEVGAAAGNGAWHVNDVTSPSTPVRLFDVAYAVSGADQKTLTFTVAAGRPPAERLGGGSIVSYQTAGDQVTLQVQDVSTGGEETISWSQATKAGSLVGLDGTKSCWDTATKQFADVACP